MTGSAQPTAAQPVPSFAQAARLRHIEALARRAQLHEGPARRLMDTRLQQLRDALAAESGADNAQQAAEGPTGPQGHHGLTQLLAHINGGPAAPAEGGAPSGAPGAPVHVRQPASTASPRTHLPVPKPPAAAPELKAISQYRSTWSRLSAEQRLHQALAQVPSNAGPLNTQRLLHQALAAMRDASPHYLHRFMVQVETLLWLEQLNTVATPAAASKAPGRKTRA